jgi:hypothetical protein
MHILKIQIVQSTDANDRIETAILLSYIYVGAVNIFDGFQMIFSVQILQCVHCS